MFSTLWHTLKRWLAPGSGELDAGARPAPRLADGASATRPAAQPAEALSPSPPVPYDEALLDRARTQWQFGDWASLAGITHEQIQHHPDRAKLALLAAAGLQQLGRADEAKALTRKALDWGCSPRLVRQILISGMHNSLARANAILGQEQEAMKHFEAAIDTGAPNADRLVKAARATFQLNLIGVPASFQLSWAGASRPPVAAAGNAATEQREHA
jgi:tetratricopeptide (TPR) repeat protein